MVDVVALEAGEVVQVFEMRRMPSGTVWLRTKHGWVPELDPTGAIQLERRGTPRAREPAPGLSTEGAAQMASNAGVIAGEQGQREWSLLLCCLVYMH